MNTPYTPVTRKSRLAKKLLTRCCTDQEQMTPQKRIIDVSRIMVMDKPSTPRERSIFNDGIQGILSVNWRAPKFGSNRCRSKNVKYSASVENNKDTVRMVFGKRLGVSSTKPSPIKGQRSMERRIGKFKLGSPSDDDDDRRYDDDKR